MNNKVFRLVYLITMIVFMTSCIMLAVRLLEIQHGNEFYAQTAGTGEVISPIPGALAPSDVVPFLPAGRQEAAAPAELPARLLQFAGEYPGAAAWLQIPGTPVDYPVMLGEDNQFYLNHLPDGNANALGSLFFDYRSSEGSRNFIIYGHSGASGKMFSAVKQYEEQEYFLGHSTLTIATAEAWYRCPIFSVRRTAADSSAYTIEFEDQAALLNYMDQAAAESIYPIDTARSDAAGVLTLSTCTGWPNQRLIVQAVIPEPFW